MPSTRRHNFPSAGHVTTVTFTARDGAGNETSKSSTLTVQDQEDPMLFLPANLTITAPAGETSVPATNTAIVDFLNGGTATDNVDGTLPAPAVSPPANFLVGTTTMVAFRADDSAGNFAAGFSQVTVTAPLTITGSYAMTCTADGGLNPITSGQANAEMEGLSGITFPGNPTAVVNGDDLNNVTVMGIPPTSVEGPAFVSAGNPNVVQSGSLTGVINIGGQDFFMIPSSTWFMDIGQYQVRWGMRAPGAGLAGQNLEAFWQCNGFK